MASPHVAAVAALMVEKDSAASPADIRERLRQTASDLGSPDRDDQYGYGLINPAAAISSSLGGGGTTESSTNELPVASFTSNCTELSCDFDASGSFDNDGSILSYSWDFGDGNSGNGLNVTHQYTTGNSYTVTLTVTDNSNDTSAFNSVVNVTEPNEVSGPSDFTLEAMKSTIGRTTKIILSWDQGVAIDLERDGQQLTSSDTTGSYTDNLGKSPSGRYNYFACEAVPGGTCKGVSVDL